jgi:uncharacterized protein (DUF1499 family)
MTTTPDTPKKFRLLPVLVLAFVFIWVATRIVFPDLPSPLAGNSPESLGVVSGRLSPCPNTPNCVSSQSTDTVHAIAAIPYTGDPEKAIERVATILESQPRTKITAREGNYLQAESASQWMGFVDDVEFLADPDRSVIDARSASRLGESDLGVNRQRIETIRALFTAKSDK